MSNQNDGGPAFPRIANLSVEGMDGMSLRDYYAGQALIGLVLANEHQDKPLGWGADTVAIAATEYADAMIRNARR